MRRIRNSVKAIIISLCLVVVFAGTLVGVILANKNKGDNNPAGNGGSGIITDNLTEEQKQFVQDLNKYVPADAAVKYAGVFDEEEYVYESGEKIDKSLIQTAYEDYFVSRTSDRNSTIYLKIEDNQKTYYKNVYDYIETQNVVKYNFNDFKNDLVSLRYVTFDGSVYDLTVCLLDVSDVNNVHVFYEYVIQDLPSIQEVENRDSSISLKDAYYVVEIYEDENNFDCFFYTYNSSVSVKEHSVDRNKLDNFYYGGNAYLFNQDDKFFAGYFDDDFVSYEFELENVSKYYTCGDLVFFEIAETIERVEDKTELTVGNVNYSYKLYNIKTNEIEDYELSTGFAKAYFDQSLSGYIDVYEEKYVNDVKESGKFTYYDLNLNPIITYSADSRYQNIIYSNGSRFLSGKGILTTDKSVNASFVVEFNSSEFNYSLYSKSVNNNTFVVFDNNAHFKILDMSGNFVFDDNFIYEPYSYDNGYYVYDGITQKVILNTSTKTKTEISNFADVNHFIFNGGGYYLTNNADEGYSFFDYKGDLIYADVKSFDFNATTERTFLTITRNNNDKVYYVLDRVINIPGEEEPTAESYSTSNNVETYDSHSGSVDNCSYTFEYWYGDSNADWNIKMTCSSGYYVSSGKFNIGRNGTNNDAWFNFNTSGITSCDMYGGGTPSFSETHESGVYKYTISGHVGNYSGNDNNSEMPNTADFCESLNVSKIAISIYYSNQGNFPIGYSSIAYDTIGVNMNDYNTPTTIGYTFSSWSEDSGYVSDDNGDQLFDFWPTIRDRFVTFTASWTANKYNISYDLNASGDTTAALGVDKPASLTFGPAGGAHDANISNPTRFGWHFTGWNISGMATNCTHYWGGAGHGEDATASGVTASTGFLNLHSVTDATVTLKATWSRNKFQISLNFGYDNYSSNNSADIIEITYFSSGLISNISTPSNSESKIYKNVYATSNFYGKFGSSDSSGSPESYSMGSSYQFTYDAGYTFDSGFYSDSFGKDFRCLNPEESSYYNVNTIGIQYTIVGWAIYLPGPSSSPSTGKLAYIDGNNSTTLKAYLEALVASGVSNVQYTSSVTTITLYAVYEPKEYIINAAVDTHYGLGSLKNENVGEPNDGHQSLTTVKWEAHITDEATSKAFGPSTPLTAMAANKVSFTIEINNNAGEDKYKDYYIFDKIEILNVGYVNNTGTYRYANIVLTWGGENNGVVTVKVNRRSSSKARDTSGVYMLNGSQYVYSISASSDPTEGDDKYYFINGNQNNINGFKFSNASKTAITIDFINLGYAGNEQDTGDSDSDGCKDYTISSDSVNGKGKYGFTIKTYFKSNYKDTKSYESADSITSNWDSVNDSNNQSFIGNELTTTANYLKMTNVISVSSGYNLFKQVSPEQRESNAACQVRYFWLNGIKYVFKTANDEYPDTTSDSNFVGYYEITTDYLKYTLESGKQLFYFNESSGEFIAKIAKRVSDVSLHDWNNTLIVYCDGSFVYYLPNYEFNNDTGSSHVGNYTSYNNTQILAIAPQQTLTKFSNKPVDAKYDNAESNRKYRYELDYYLSTFTIGGNDYKLHDGMDLKNYNSGTYDKFKPLRSNNSITVAEDKKIKYLGEYYNVKYAYQFEADSRIFVLYFTVRVNSDGSYKDNYVMYFLYTAVGSAGYESIGLTFTKLQYDITVNVTDIEDNNGFDTNPDNATVTYYNTSVSNVNIISSGYAYSDSYHVDSFSKKYNNIIYPSELRVIKISPKDGYILSSVNVKLNGNAIMKFSLYSVNIGQLTISDKKFYSYVYSDTTGAQAVNRYYIKYLPESNIVFDVDKFVDSSNWYYSGIYFSETANTGWNIDKNNDVTKPNAPAFESIYLLVSGIYHDVTIDVETASYIEFSFDNENDILGLTPADRYNTNGLEFNKSNKGEYYVQFKEIDVIGTRYAQFLESNGGKDGEILGEDNKYYRPGTSNSHYFVKINPNDANCKVFIIIYKQDGNNYEASGQGIYIVDKQSTKIDELYPYLGYDEAMVDSRVDYMLSDIKNLSIIVNADKKIGSQNVLDCATPENLLEASLVKQDDKLIRAIFIGKSSYFKNGVKILASGKNYSVYFTNGLAYNDDGDDAAGFTDDKEVTVFKYLNEAEGRTSDDKELNIDYQANTNVLTFNDKLTYMQIDNIQKFFKTTAFNRDGNGFEFARKYFLNVNTQENNVSLNVNSYISNSSSDLMTGTVSDKDDANYGKSYYDAYNRQYTIGGVNGNDKAGDVFGSNTLTVRSDSRKTISDFSLTVSNEVSNSSIFSPFMWLGNQLYQLDYVDDATSRYSKEKSWFNDTVLTNIDYKFNRNVETPGVVNGNALIGNWQEQGTNALMNKSKTIEANHYEAIPNPSISGYQIEFEYFVIPGYYLEYIIVETIDYGLFYIPLSTVGNSSAGQIKYDLTNTPIDTKIHYSVEYVHVDDYDSKYVIKLYATEENDYHDSNGLNSIGLLSNNVTVNFFSHAYSIDIKYYTNADSLNISTEPSYSSTTNKDGIVTQSLTYDTLGVLTEIVSMEGYSFVGWGSKTYDGSTDRFNEANLIWNSSSTWLPVKVGPNSSATSNYFKYDDDRENRPNRNALFNLGVAGYEIYIKSSHTDRKDTTGYFVTDTGNAFSSIGGQENYNFWSAYSTIFKQSMKHRYPAGEYAFSASGGTKYSIDLYAIWKANVYAVELNFNDVNQKMVNNNDKTNGSTYANLALGRPKSYDGYIWNDTLNVNNDLYKYTLGNLGYSNKITQEVYKEAGNGTLDAGISDNYYCYVTFDKNDWYVISANSVSNFNTTEYSMGKHVDTQTKPFVNTAGTGAVNQLDFVIDRYGYSWLGWFSEKLANTYENKFSDNKNIVFGSDYYYSRSDGEREYTSGDKSTRVMPYLRGWGENDYPHADTFVSIDEFENSANGTEVVDNNTTVYSEVVYKGEEYFRNSGEYYLYHYDYKTQLQSGIYVNEDYLNCTIFSESRPYLIASSEVDNKAIFAYYDTSLTLDSYVKNNDLKLDVAPGGMVQINRTRTNNNGENESGAIANYRYITLYAYWLVNDYNVVVDYRDNDDTVGSIYEIGSSQVTNKADIEADYSLNDVDESGDKYNIHNTYFDDDGYTYVLNTAIPNRVGYDFIGWSFFFRNPTIPTKAEVSNGFANGQLYKYNGLQTASGNYVLCLSTITNRYYYDEIDGATDALYNDVFSLYNQTAVKTGDVYNYSYYLSELSNVKYTQLNTNKETFGDAEGDGNRYIYIFAMWRAQTFTIDVNLNIDTSDLINGYDQDSSYSVGFYESYDASNNIVENEKGFIGINSLFVRQRPNNNDIDDYDNIFTEVVSNLTFVIYFDEPLSSAMFTEPNAAEVRYYYLADLFAVSTGYYLIDWLRDSDDATSRIIANSLRTEYGYNSNLVNRYAAGARTQKSDLDIIFFNYDYYDTLYNTNYKNMTSTPIIDEHGIGITGSSFEQSNTNKVAATETSSTTATGGNNASFASTNFGYVLVDGKKCYIQPEFVDVSGGSDGVTDSYNLYYRFDGKKHYVLFYLAPQNLPKVILTNDLTYLYITPNGSTNRYVVRFDSVGKPYYVPNSTYKDMVYLDTTLQIAVFDSTDFAIQDDKSTYIDTNNKYTDAAHKISGFVAQTTRQFSVYANWQIKDDFYVSYINGNSGEDEVVDDEPTGNVLKSNISNQGLAGFYASYLNGAIVPELMTQNKVAAGGESYLMGYDIDEIRHNYKTYDDFGFDVIPFLNGRYISEVAIEFDRFEAVASTGVTAVHQKVKYKLTLSFAWVNNADTAENIIKITEIKLWKYDPEPDVGEPGYPTMPIMSVVLNINNQIVTIKADDENTESLYTYLSLLSHISFEGITLFDISDYGTDTGGDNVLTMRDGTPFNRRDVNRLRFNFTDLMTSVYVTCKFSVQTYDLKVHHLFDENGDTLIQSTSNRASYTSQYNEILDGEHYESKDSLESSQVWTDTTPTGKNQALATIPDTLTADSAAVTYNIPYGYFLYGAYYDSALVGYRPMDDYYGSGANNGLNYKGDLAHKTNITYKKSDGVTNIVEEVSFDGFNFIYSEGNYTKGRGGTGLLLDGDGGDAYIDQGSPLLGSSVNFPTKSIRYNKSFYLFKGWYEVSGMSGGFITFDAYNDIDEASYIKRNIVLYGYYYSNNTPTNIQFYTWNNDYNENSPAYLPYTNNADEYTLSSSDEMSPFIVDSGYLLPSANAVDYVDSEGRLILKHNVEYGVNSSRFSLDEFSGYELSNSVPSDLSLLNNILKTYWYYEEEYTVLYAQNLDGEEKVYIKYDPEVWSEYEYIQLAGGVQGMIVNTEQYEQYLQDGITSFERLAMTSIEGDSGSATLEAGGTATISYDSTFAKYYFQNPHDGKYYFFSKDIKNTVMTKRILKKNAFYYEYGTNQIKEVKVNSSDDMGNTKLYIYNDGTGEFDIEKPLEQEHIYTYGDRFMGAELYAMIGNGSSAKYYKYHKVPESVIENAPENSFIDIYEPRYYVDIAGVRYYTMIHKNRDKGTHNDDKMFTDLFNEDGVKASSITYNIVTLNNYYVLLDDTYYKINFEELVDAQDSVYVNPMQNPSTVELPYGNSTRLYYFDYQNNSNTSGLFEKYESGEYEDAVLYEYRIYTPISKNYTLNAVLKNNFWISSDITLNAFPSLNMDYWYNNPDYVLLGYLNVSNIDIEIMKRNENEGAVYENSQYSYIPSLNQLVNTDEYLANPTAGAYTVFGTVDWFNSRLTIADSGHVLSIYYDDKISKYYFLYQGEDGSTVYYYFDKDTQNVVQIMHEQGGQLFNAYSDYIDNKYAGATYDDLREKLKEAVAGKAREFGLSDLLRAPMFVDSYQLSSIDHKSIERVIMRISSQFVFTWAEIQEFELEAYCETVPGLAVEIEEGVYQITISSTFKYAFGLVTTKTQINTNIYAIPVFVPDVIKFTETDAFTTGAVSYSGNIVNIDYSKMNVTHYDLLNQKLYQSDYVWDLPELPGNATPENEAERNALLKAADWLQFVMIDSAQFEEMSDSIIGCDVKLDTMITEHGLTVLSQKDLTKDNQVLSFDMTGKDGEFYVFAFYYPIGTAENANKHIHRVSDNYVKVVVESGVVKSFEIVKNTMTQS